MTTKTQKFKPVEFDGPLVWIKSTEGEKRGLQFGVEATPEQMSRLEKQCEIKLTVRSINSKNTAWELVEIHDT